MKVITFCGDCTYLDQVDYDFVIVDQTYNYNLPDDAHDVVYNETGSRDRQVRIAKNLLAALKLAKYVSKDTFAIIDSDIIMPNLRAVEGHPMLKDHIFTLCYPLYYDWANEDRPFCSGTNYVFTSDKISEIEHIINNWLNLSQSSCDKIDIYVHDRLNHINVFIPPVSHYIKKCQGGQKVTYDINDYGLILRHIPEFTLLITR